MRHRQAGKHFSRTPAHREALFRNLSRSLITHERIVTTLPKAKALRPYIEKLITLAKKAAVITAAAPEGDKVARVKALHLRRQAATILGPTHGTAVVDKNDEVVEGDTILKKLFRDIGPRYKERPGGYTRIIKQHYRRLGDGGHTAVIELLKEGEQKVRLNAKAAPAPAPAPAAPTA
ncbi:50S ribosomal protein L17 [Urbifossiella limnaea]|uniref:Large ribosomal subunit protein bL17 n=1 Tax=Urbifossiella limnaea TaxID=2528023 RepID=A0A517XRQ8_9BACT|nr:50S ribosomal protein L17 [Urbifossiella limnaea]QDU20195.1 50S ribosomal protein L17 [Urbifossiella limnaea]